MGKKEMANEKRELVLYRSFLCFSRKLLLIFPLDYQFPSRKCSAVSTYTWSPPPIPSHPDASSAAGGGVATVSLGGPPIGGPPLGGPPAFGGGGTLPVLLPPPPPPPPSNSRLFCSPSLK